MKPVIEYIIVGLIVVAVATGLFCMGWQLGASQQRYRDMVPTDTRVSYDPSSV